MNALGVKQRGGHASASVGVATHNRNNIKKQRQQRQPSSAHRNPSSGSGPALLTMILFFVLVVLLVLQVSGYQMCLVQPMSTEIRASSKTTTTTTNASTLPRWIQDYVTWHAQQRQLYPNMELFENPNAPKLLVRTCLGICGGLHDRIGQLPWDLYLAAKTKRVLLMAWQRPKELENFLLPNNNKDLLALDWRVPKQAKFGFDGMKHVRNFTQLFENYAEDHPDDEFWNVHMDASLERALDDDSHHSSQRILRHRLLGHLNEKLLEEKMQREGFYDNDPDHSASELHVASTFGAIFHLFFRLNPAIQKELNAIQQDLGLVPQRYMAVHCRVRHPKAHVKGKVVKGKNENYPADKTGLPWDEGNPIREFACQTAQTALECARDIGGGNNHKDMLPIYFLADSNDLVRHVTIELQDTNGYLKHNKTGIFQPLLEEVQAVPQRRIVARDVTLENVHIDRQKGRDPPAYYGTFIDLYLAMQAKCIVYGIGYYAAFAAKISGTNCSYLYAEEAWGSQVSKQAHNCPNTFGVVKEKQDD